MQISMNLVCDNLGVQTSDAADDLIVYNSD